jgi:hypothetical protein
MFGSLSIPIIPRLLRLQISSNGRMYLKWRIR